VRHQKREINLVMDEKGLGLWKGSIKQCGEEGVRGLQRGNWERR